MRRLSVFTAAAARLLGAALLTAAVAGSASAARADATHLTSVADVHAACESVAEMVRPRPYVVDVDPGWRFGRARDGRLFVDTRRNLSAMDGHVSLLLAGLEPVSLEATAEEARALRDAAAAGATLRIGFFLGFDDASRRACLLRNQHAVTIVRADFAFVELVSSAGERISRAEADRLLAWADDHDELSIPGEGPRGVLGEARFANGTEPPSAWLRAINAPAAQRRIGRCHAAGVRRGASAEGQVVVRLNVETRTGRVRRSDVALSSVGDDEEAECIAQAVGRGASFPPGPSSWAAEVVDVSVPVRLAGD